MLENPTSRTLSDGTRLEEVGIPRDIIIRQPIEVSAFGGNVSFTLDFIDLDLTI